METEYTTITRRLKRFDPLQMGKMLGALYGIMGLMFIPFALIMGAASMAAPSSATGEAAAVMGVGLVFGLLAPFIYGGMGFIFGIIGALLYNLLAKWLGGIEFELE